MRQRRHRVTPIEVLKGPTHDLHVLLRHRPPSISLSLFVHCDSGREDASAAAYASLRQRRCSSSHRWRARRRRCRAYAPGARRRAGVALPLVVLCRRPGRDRRHARSHAHLGRRVTKPAANSLAWDGALACGIEGNWLATVGDCAQRALRTVCLARGRSRRSADRSSLSPAHTTRRTRGRDPAHGLANRSAPVADRWRPRPGGLDPHHLTGRSNAAALA